MNFYSIKQFSQLTDLTPHTLRYYEKEQLLVVNRDSSGRRAYSPEDIDWILFVKRLKDTGMTIKEIRQYAVLRYQGDSSMSARLEILEKHKLLVLAEKEKWETNLRNLEEKIHFYKNRLQRTQQ